MKSSGIEPVNKASNTGSRKNNKSASFDFNHDRRQNREFAGLPEKGKGDMLSFSELMQRCRQVDEGIPSKNKDDELRLFMKTVSSDNEKIARMARGLNAKPEYMSQFPGYSVIKPRIIEWIPQRD